MGVSTESPIGPTIMGYPRIGPRRELKRALEDHWAGRADRAHLDDVARGLRLAVVRTLEDAGLGSVPGSSSLYDPMLDAAVMVGAVPARFAALDLDETDTAFAMARGAKGVPALELSKWFDTNYHYLVPELGPDTPLRLAGTQPVDHLVEASEAGVGTRPVVVGPLTFLLLAKPADDAPQGFTPLDLLDPLVEVYVDLLQRLAEAGAGWVQLDEPALVTDLDAGQLAAVERAYERLTGLASGPEVLVAAPFGDLGPALDVLTSAGVDGLAVDLVTGRSPVDTTAAPERLRSLHLVAGVVDGRNVWRTDLDAALDQLEALSGAVGSLTVGTSCSLLHVPYDVEVETGLEPELRGWLAFARQKVDEVVLLQAALTAGRDADTVADQLDEARAGLARRRSSAAVRDAAVAERVAGLTPGDRERAPFPERAAVQQTALGLPALPTTTIGSFPQTREVRMARAAHRRGELSPADYTARMRAEVERVVRLQEDIGLDVLVHGEPERNDMVQHFGELLDGFAFTEYGWVQSYGSRCVRPPILYGDVSRPAPMTVDWATYAQSLTDRPVKGMLTGPVTILAWSFVRDDQPLADTATQVALALRDEVADLQAAGIRIVQVDEPALRELLPLREVGRPDYRRWAVDAFRLATAGAATSTQVHTHMCYSEFAEIFDLIDGLDADVTSIEAARSRMEVLADLAAGGFARGVGPGVYDIHSPRIPSAEEQADLLRAARASVPPHLLWANPDCGLKTRDYPETEASLRNLVAAAHQVRLEA